MTTTTYAVSGMTCEHCVAAVTGQLAALPGVTDVAVELRPNERSLVFVTSTEPLSGNVVAEAIDEAGYQLVTPSVAAGRPTPQRNTLDQKCPSILNPRR